MKVKIVKCAQSSYWYADKVGEEFEVVPIEGLSERYEIIEDVPPAGLRRFVQKSDVVEVKEVDEMSEEKTGELVVMVSAYGKTVSLSDHEDMDVHVAFDMAMKALVGIGYTTGALESAALDYANACEACAEEQLGKDVKKEG